MEELKNEIILHIKNTLSLNNESLMIIDHIIGNSMRNYKIEKICTDISIITNKYCPELEAFIVRKEFKGLSQSSIKQYKYLLSNFIAWLDKDVKEVTSDDIRAFLDDYAKINHITDRTKDGKRLIICSFYQFLHQNGYIKSNPAVSVEKIKYKQKVREPLTYKEVNSMRKACKTDLDKALFETFFSTGCRVGEIVNMKISDIDFINDQVKVCGKGNKERFVLLNTEAHIAIQTYLKTRHDNNPYLFVDCRNNMNKKSGLSKWTLEDRISKISKNTKINKKITPHVIRHTAITYWAEKGMPLDVIQTLAGHANIETTRIYLHTSLQRIRKIYKNILHC